MVIKEVLVATRNRISAPSAWRQGVLVTSAEGEEVLFTDPAAACWCLVGAIYVSAKVVGTPRAFEDTLWAVAKTLKGPCGLDSAEEIVTSWNDDESRTHAEVLDFLNEAIKFV